MINGSIYQRRVMGNRLPLLGRMVDALREAAVEVDGVEDDERITRLWRLARKLEGCCVHPVVLGRDDDDRLMFRECRCRSRICPYCRECRRREVVAQLVATLDRMDSTRFMTFTLLSCDAPLGEQLIRLRSTFSRLRRTKLWRDRVDGGLYTVEVTYNRKTGQWHPHIHAVAEGKYIPQALLADEWERITGDSRVVDIRACRSRRQAVKYLAEYVQKTSDVEKFPMSAIAEWAVEVHGLRFVAKFGTMYGRSARGEGEGVAEGRSENVGQSIHSGDPDSSERERSPWRIVAYIEPLLSAAARGDGEAAVLAQCIEAGRRRKADDGEPGFVIATEPGSVSFVERIRAWKRREEELRCGGARASGRTCRKRGPPDGQQWFRQIIDDRVAEVVVSAGVDGLQSTAAGGCTSDRLV